MSQKIEKIRLDWADLKHRLIDQLEHNRPWRQAAKRTILQPMYADPYTVNEWRGGSCAQTLEWLRNGFFADELQAAADLVPVSASVRSGWSEDEGDVDAGRLYGGYDDFYYEVQPSDAKPGLRIEVDMFFAALCSPTTLRAYGAWVAGLIGTLEANGFDVEVDLILPVTNLYEGARGRQDVAITVKRAGELSDFTEWSACLSPVGTRVLMFTAFGVASDKVGKRQTAHMATSLDTSARNWGVTFDQEANTLRITANQRQGGANAFPIDRMNDQLASAGLLEARI
jgi:hypothetical protein